MKKYYFSLILMTAIFAELITSCDKEDTAVGMTVSGNLEFSESYNDIITKVQVDVKEPVNVGVTVFKSVNLARGTYSNGAFSIELPAMVDERYLKQSFSDKDLDTYFKISDKRVKTGVFDFTATDFDETIANSIEEKNKEGNGIWVYAYKTFPLVYIKKDDVSTTEGLFYYADKNCSINGTMTASDGHYSLTYSMHLKRGWNIVYFTEKYVETPEMQIHIEELSTKPVSGLKWYVRGDFY